LPNSDAANSPQENAVPFRPNSDTRAFVSAGVTPLDQRCSEPCPILLHMTARLKFRQYVSGPGSTGVHRVFFTTDKKELLDA
jgi:hypothetical protein